MKFTQKTNLSNVNNFTLQQFLKVYKTYCNLLNENNFLDYEKDIIPFIYLIRDFSYLVTSAKHRLAHPLGIKKQTLCQGFCLFPVDFAPLVSYGNTQQNQQRNLGHIPLCGGNRNLLACVGVCAKIAFLSNCGVHRIYYSKGSKSPFPCVP